MTIALNLAWNWLKKNLNWKDCVMIALAVIILGLWISHGIKERRHERALQHEKREHAQSIDLLRAATRKEILTRKIIADSLAKRTDSLTAQLAVYDERLEAIRKERDRIKSKSDENTTIIIGASERKLDSILRSE